MTELERIFDTVLSVPPSHRGPLLDAMCAGNRGLRDEIASLLAAYDASGEFFEQLGRQAVAPALVAFADLTDEWPAPGDRVGRYEVVERIGRGGMGIVYAAIDRTLDRRVALKFLPAPLSADPAARARFLTEARAASRLDHPNIGVIHETGEAGGRPFIAMALYEGETLDRKIARGPLTADETVDIARQIAGALATAHQKGVIHRDVKPSNIVITPAGLAKLLDFGAATLADTEPSRAGLLQGTVAYMSPEQTRAAPVDHRTDVWSFGVVLCEMLTGVRPFRGDNDSAVIEAIRHRPWLADRRALEDVPTALVSVLDRCLEKEAGRRYARMQDLLDELDALSARGRPALRGGSSSRAALGRMRRTALRYAILAALPLALLWTTFYPTGIDRDAGSGTSVAALRRVAVLPLENAGADPDDGYLAGGLTTELIAGLSQVEGLRVIARSSVLPHEGSAGSVADIGRILGAGALLEGSVQRSGNRVRVDAQLVDTAGEKQLWAGSFDAALEDLPGVQREIVRRVAGVLRSSGDAGNGTTTGSGTPVAAAYTEYLKGRYFLAKRDESSARLARDHFRRALDLDPTFAGAWTGWSDTLDLLVWLTILRPPDAYPQARAAAERALALDPQLADAHVSLARVLFRHDFEFEAAASHLRQAIALNPSHPGARHAYAIYQRMRGRFDEALQELQAASELDPLSPMHQVEVGVTLYAARRHDDALAHYRRVLDVRPDFTPVHFFMALVHMQQQRYAEALMALDQDMPAERWHDRETLRAAILAMMGRDAEARGHLCEIARAFPAAPVAPWHPAIVHLALGEHERALDLLERAFDERALHIPLLPVEPIFDPVRAHPRFVALLDRLQR